MKKVRKAQTAYLFEVALIFILSVAMIAMFAAYCGIKNATRYRTSQTTDFAAHGIDPENDLGILSPDFIGICTDTKISPSTPQARNELLKEIRPFITSVFSDVSTILEFSDENARDAFVENRLYGAKDYLYLLFSKPLPANALVPAITGERQSKSIHAFNVSELFIFCESGGAVSGIAVDGEGGIATLTVRDRTSLSFDTLKAYETNESFSEFVFGKLHGKSFPLMLHSVSRPRIAAYNSNGDFSSHGSDTIKGVLSAFGFNPNGTSFYRTGNRIITYVEDSGELKLFADGAVEYISRTDRNSTTALATTFEQKIALVHTIVSRLDSNHYGNVARLTLDTISFDEEKEELCVNLCYTVDGIKLLTESDEQDTAADASFVFSGERLSRAVLSKKSYSYLDTGYSYIPQRLLFDFLADKQEYMPDAFLPVYSKGQNDSFNAKYAFVINSQAKEASTENREVTEQ